LADALAIQLHVLGNETTSGTGAAVDIGLQRSCLALDLQIHELIGAKLETLIQTAPTADGPWSQLAALPTVTAAVTRDDVVIVEAKRFVRIVWTITGSANFYVGGFAHTLFARPKDVTRFAFPAKASESVARDVMASACLAATEEAMTYLKGRFTPPILSWGMDLTKHVAKMAGFDVMSHRGFQPGGFDELIVKGRDDAIAYLKMVQKNDLQPPAIIDADPANVGTDDAYVIEQAESFWDTL
jgi:phage gp36-like protein